MIYLYDEINLQNIMTRSKESIKDNCNIGRTHLNIGNLSLRIESKDKTNFKKIEEKIKCENFYYATDKVGQKYTFTIQKINKINNGLYCKLYYVIVGCYLNQIYFHLQTTRLECELEFPMCYENFISETKIDLKDDITIGIEIKPKGMINGDFVVSLILTCNVDATLDPYVFDVLDLIYLHFGMMPRWFKSIYLFGEDSATLYREQPSEYMSNDGYRKKSY